LATDATSRTRTPFYSALAVRHIWARPHYRDIRDLRDNAMPPRERACTDRSRCMRAPRNWSRAGRSGAGSCCHRPRRQGCYNCPRNLRIGPRIVPLSRPLPVSWALRCL